jgi:aminoglycoside/choline kinase family phosphotransferase
MGQVELEAEARAWIAGAVGTEVREMTQMIGGAGARRYWRIELADSRTLVLMLALAEEPAILPPALRDPGVPLPFVHVTRLLADQGIAVPTIHAFDEDRRWILLEDLGTRHLCDLNEQRRASFERDAMSLLARVHGISNRGGIPFQRCFDADWIRFELRTFQLHGVRDAEPRLLDAALDALAGHIERLPRCLCLRDFQSQNLMIDAQEHLRVIDYQDALLAPPELDLAAFLWDAYIERNAASRDALLEHYEKARGQPVDRSALATLVVQRKCKDFGRYRWLSEQRGDNRYAIYIEPARAALLTALDELPATLADVATALRTGVAIRA